MSAYVMNVAEEEVGISLYWTEGVPGIMGRLKKQPEDFQVTEKSLFPPEVADGNLTAVVVRQRNWELNRLVRKLSSNLRIGREKIGFAGMKDKRAISTQLMTFPKTPEELSTLSLPDVDLLEMYRTRTQIRLGALLGNAFSIIVREVEKENLKERVETVNAQLTELGGFPNFFGIQRFGAARPITHLIGKSIIQSDFKRAAMTYISDDNEFEDEEARSARRFVRDTEDFAEALKIFPDNMSFEKILLGYLAKQNEDYIGAIKKLPRNLIMMFVHAYQSYLFNKMLSMRIKQGLPIDRPQEGDIILPLDKNALPSHSRFISVNGSNIDRAEAQVLEGKGFVSAAIFGADSVLADGVMGEIEREVIEDESIVAEDFIVPDLMTASSRGMRRAILAPVNALQLELGADSVKFSFELNKGCYATSFLREFMKAPRNCY